MAFFLPSQITRVLYRLCGFKIGKNVTLPLFSFVYADAMLLGNDVEIRNFVFITVRKLSLGSNTIISFGAQIKGHKDFCTGDNCMVGAHCVVNCEENVSLGFYSGLGPRSTVYSHGSFLPVTRGYPAKFEPVIFDDYVWVGMGVKILPGVHIGSNSIINPGVVLHKNVRPNSLVQFSSEAFAHYDLGKLRRFNSKSNLFYLEKIIIDFINYLDVDFTHDKENFTFVINKKHTIHYKPSENIIEILFTKKKPVVYDLDNFVSGRSNHRLHAKFLFFLRRRFGLILRTRY